MVGETHKNKTKWVDENHMGNVAHQEGRVWYCTYTPKIKNVSRIPVKKRSGYHPGEGGGRRKREVPGEQKVVEMVTEEYCWKSGRAQVEVGAISRERERERAKRCNVESLNNRT